MHSHFFTAEFFTILLSATKSWCSGQCHLQFLKFRVRQFRQSYQICWSNYIANNNFRFISIWSCQPFSHGSQASINDKTDTNQVRRQIVTQQKLTNFISELKKYNDRLFGSLMFQCMVPTNCIASMLGIKYSCLFALISVSKTINAIAGRDFSGILLHVEKELIMKENVNFNFKPKSFC